MDFLNQVVLGEIRRLTKFASHYEDDFLKAVMGSSQESVALDRKLKEKELAALQARDEKLDGLFERIYEDNVSGKLSDDHFAKMSRRYEQEQKGLAEKSRCSALKWIDWAARHDFGYVHLHCPQIHTGEETDASYAE